MFFCSQSYNLQKTLQHKLLRAGIYKSFSVMLFSKILLIYNVNQKLSFPLLCKMFNCTKHSLRPNLVKTANKVFVEVFSENCKLIIRCSNF